MRVNACAGVCDFKTQWNLAPTEDRDEGASSEQEAVRDQSWCVLCARCRVHVFLHTPAHTLASTQTLYIAISGLMFSQSQRASSYCIMLRIWKGFSSSYGRTRLILLNLTGESLPLGKDQRARALALLPVPLLLACTHGRERHWSLLKHESFYFL